MIGFETKNGSKYLGMGKFSGAQKCLIFALPSFLGALELEPLGL